MAETSECPENAENREGNEGTRGLPRSQSERFLTVCKVHAQQERELQEKYYENLFTTVEKVMKASQSNQLKMLQVLFDRETADVKRKLQTTRQGEVLVYYNTFLHNEIYKVTKLIVEYILFALGQAIGQGAQRQSRAGTYKTRSRKIDRGKSRKRMYALNENL